MNDPTTSPAAKTSQNARYVAMTALRDVFVRHQPLDLFYEKNRAFANLPDNDKAFCRAITGTCLRRLGQINQVLDALVERPLPRSAVLPRALLQIGAAELLFMRSASHGVVHSLVALAGRTHKARPYKGLINAVLRKIAITGVSLLQSTDIKSNIPEPLAGNWLKLYGDKTLANASSALKEQPPLDITLLRNKDHWASKLAGVRLTPQTIRLARSGKIEGLPGFGEGDWIVQDVSAALPALLLAAKPGERIADFCAAPGGKTMQLAAAGAMVTAIDRSESRLERLRENLNRTALEAKIVHANAAGFTVSQKFDAILLDAPCSASGIFRHHPDVLYHARVRNLQNRQQQQLELANNAIRQLKSKGRLLYCVCSAEPQEGEEIIAELAQNTQLSPMPFLKDESLIAADFLENGMIRIPPGSQHFAGGMDGFFMARLQKT